MKQIIQDLKSGSTILEEVPVPQVKSGYVLIQTTRTLVSLGTERMLVEFGKANLIDKARQQPDKVKQVLDKIKTDGLQPTLEAVFNKLGQPLPLGYCNVGRVVAVGKGVAEFKVGDRVASNGNHAEFVCVPKNLVAKVPDDITDEEAAFTVIGSIGLQGIRLLNPQLGETVVVVGLGLIGLVAAQLLGANGCKVIGVDFDQQKVDMAASKGIVAINPGKGTDPVRFVEDYTGGIGADGVLITASTQSHEVIHQACEMSRKRGRIVFVGFQVPGTLGHSLLNGVKEVKLFGEQIEVHAKIMNLPGLSGHADKRMLTEWIKAYKTPLKRVFIVHGDDEVCDGFAAYLREELGLDAVAPYSGDTFDLVLNQQTAQGSRDLVKKKTKSSKASSNVFARLLAAGERLLAVIQKNEGTANKDMAKFADQINALCEKWDR